MTDVGYVAAGYLLTAAAVGGYAAALRSKARRVENALNALRRAPGPRR